MKNGSIYFSSFWTKNFVHLYRSVEGMIFLKTFLTHPLWMKKNRAKIIACKKILVGGLELALEMVTVFFCRPTRPFLVTIFSNSALEI